MFGKDAELISMLWCAKAKCVSRARQTCELMFMLMSIWMGQEAEGGLVVGQGKVGGFAIPCWTPRR